MSATKRRQILSIIATDTTFELRAYRGQTVWVGKCIQCNRKVAVDQKGEPVGHATIEHIVPRNHGGTDELDNLALACGRCNSQKGYRVDHLRRDDPKLVTVIERLSEKRRDRWRAPPEDDAQ